MDRFFIDEGGCRNAIFRQKEVAAHLVLETGSPARVMVIFPAGNSGFVFMVSSYPASTAVSLNLEFAAPPRAITSSFPAGAHHLPGVAFEIRIDSNDVIISDLLLDSTRAIRQMGTKGLRERLQRRQLWRDHNPGFGDPVLQHSVEEGPGNEQVLQAWRNSLDRGRHYLGQIRPRAGSRMERLPGGNWRLRGPGDGLMIEVTAAIDFSPFLPLGIDRLLNANGTKYRERLTQAAASPGADAGVIEAHERFEAALRSLLFLAGRDKFLAGSWRFLTYFGRDTALATMMLQPVVAPEAYRVALQSIIDRMADDGCVAHEEDIGCQALDHRLELGLEPDDMPVMDYKMVDDDFLFIPMLEKYLHSGVGESEIASFFSHLNFRGETNQATLMRNWNLVLTQARPYFDHPAWWNLVRIRPGEKVGDWRDSAGGLGGGVYPASVNAFLVKAALRAMYGIRERLADRAGIVFPDRPGELEVLAGAWDRAEEHFRVRLSPQEIRSRLGAYLVDHILETGEREALLHIPLEPGCTVHDFQKGALPESLAGGLDFIALSLDEGGEPRQIMNSDFVFELFLGQPDAARLAGILDLVSLPYPLGLAVAGGILTTNPIFSLQRDHWQDLDRTRYHGTVVWAWPVVMLILGLVRQIRMGGVPNLEERLERVLEEVLARRKLAGALVHSELCSYRPRNGKLEPVAYGRGTGNETRSNPLQLWSSAELALMYTLDRYGKERHN